MIAAKTLSLQVSDLSGQASRWARGISREATIGELTDGLAGALDLPHQDGSGSAPSGTPCERTPARR